MAAAADHAQQSRDAETEASARAVIADCDSKLATHRAALEAGADPALVSGWIAETQARGAKAAAVLTSTFERPARMSREAIGELVRSVSDLAAAVRQAKAEDKAEIYRLLGLRLTYAPNNATVLAEIAPCPTNDKTPRLVKDRGEIVRVGRGTWTDTPRITPITTELELP